MRFQHKGKTYRLRPQVVRAIEDALVIALWAGMGLYIVVEWLFGWSA